MIFLFLQVKNSGINKTMSAETTDFLKTSNNSALNCKENKKNQG